MFSTQKIFLKRLNINIANFDMLSALTLFDLVSKKEKEKVKGTFY